MTLGKIQKRMLEVQEKISGGIKKEIVEKSRGRGITMPIINRQIEHKKEPFIDELEILKLKEQHIIVRRDGWLPKSIWNIIVPIIVAVLTSLIINQVI